MKANILKWVLLIIFLALWYRALFNTENRFSYTSPNYFTEKVSTKHKNLNYCHVRLKDLHVHDINLDENLVLNNIEKLHPDVLDGGEWYPKDCTPLQKVAVIIPYRDRPHHLFVLLKRLHPMLKKQKLHYRIFIINQVGETKFNRGLIINIGVIESAKLMDYDCIVMNDVDLVPENDASIYMCGANDVRQISSAIDDTRYHIMFWNNAGGVVAISKENYLNINGHPNVYWGWGNEDDDFSARTLLSGLKLTRPPEHIGRFKMVKHLRGFRNTEAYWLFLTFRGRWKYDGINSLMRLNKNEAIPETNEYNTTKYYYQTPYWLLDVHKTRLFTNISVKVTKGITKQLLHSLPYTWETWWWFLKFYGWI